MTEKDQNDKDPHKPDPDLVNATSKLKKSAAELLSSFTTPDSMSGTLTTASNQKQAQSGHVIAESSISSSSRPRQFSEASTRPDSTGVRSGVESTTTADEEYEHYLSNTDSLHPSYTYIDENDGDAVLAFLSSSHTTSAVYSPTPNSTHLPAPTPSQLGYDTLVADIMTVEDPVSYLLFTTKYTQDVWGDDWEEYQQAKKENEQGNKTAARDRVESIIGRIKAKL
ncbi:hypothetical protein V1512DRAFT_262490 [Lipomyces arxii]|uniref:uncharacterized protein n=1 Tax=Lipomyces arxii TaxID=56418 RepID=UPI0034CE2ADF